MTKRRNKHFVQRCSVCGDKARTLRSAKVAVGHIERYHACTNPECERMFKTITVETSEVVSTKQQRCNLELDLATRADNE